MRVYLLPISQPPVMRFDGAKATLPKTLREKIDSHWKGLTRANPSLFNGEVFTVTKTTTTEEGTNIELSATDYAHYLYTHSLPDVNEYTVRIVDTSTLVVSSNDMLIFGSMGKQTSRPGVIQCCGGGLDYNDVKNGLIDVESAAARELEEELGVNPHDNSLVKQFKPAYLKAGGPTGMMSVIYIMQSKLRSADLLAAYKDFAESLVLGQKEPEFEYMYSIPCDSSSIKKFVEEYHERLDEYMPSLLMHAPEALKRING